MANRLTDKTVARASSSATASREKSTGHAAEQDREDVRDAREAWFAGQFEGARCCTLTI